MLYTPQTNKVSILGSDLTPDDFGFWNIWLWNISKWDVSGIFVPWNLHKDCAVNAYNTKSGAVDNIFSLGNSYSWTGEGPIVIKYPYNRNITTIAINASACSLSAYGSTKANPSLPVVSTLDINNIDSGTLDGCVLSGDTIILDSSSGSWTSPVYDLSCESVLDFVYSGEFPTGTTVDFLFRTSHDGLNWTEWSKYYTSIDTTATITSTQKYYDISTSIFITGYVNAYVYTDTICSGTISIYGTANGGSFNRYKIQIGAGSAPSTWTDITAWISTGVSDDVIGTYDTTQQYDGYYTFRLIVEDDTIPQTVTDTVVCYFNNGLSEDEEDEEDGEEPTPIADESEITSPIENEVCSRFIEVTGSANCENFSKYEIQYYDNSTWVTFMTGNKSVDSNYLGVLYLEEGSYDIRLVVYDTDDRTVISSSISISVVGLPTADIYLDALTHYDIDTTIFIPSEYDILTKLVIPGYSFDITTSLTIYNSLDVDTDLVIPVTYSYPVDQIVPRTYIQIRAVMARDASQDIHIDKMAISYSNDWFKVCNNVSVDGITIIDLYSEDLSSLLLEFDEETTVYEFIELCRI